MGSVSFSVERCDEHIARPVIERFHYLKRWPHPLSLPFAYRLRVNDARMAPDGRPWGIVVMKKPQHGKHSGLFGMDGLPTCWQVLDLARVWVHPSLQKTPVSDERGGWTCGGPSAWIGTNRKGERVTMSPNAFSRMVGMVLRRVQRDWIDHHPPVFPDLPYHIELIISYCDLGHHDGTGYRASGFVKHGQSSDGTKDVYIRRLRRPNWRWAAAPGTVHQLSLGIFDTHMEASHA